MKDGFQERLAAEGLLSRPDVWNLVKVYRLAKAMREAQKQYYKFRAEPGPALALKDEAIRCEGRLDEAIKEFNGKTTNTTPDIKELTDLAYLAVDCRACQKRYYSHRFSPKQRMQVMIAARKAESALDKAIWVKPKQEGLGL